ncbi:MAG: hypothetical protein K0B87_08755 [Candidatus Syntrophosphaera sp.]|nr:hypothetical protein [Candidatus Syntrophosphaera sp.]
MPRFLLLLLFLAFCQLCLAEDLPPMEPDLISARIVELIDIGSPILLEVQAGDLTSALDFRIRRLLLEKGADLRERDPDGPDSFTADSLWQSGFAPHALASFNLVRVTMELGGTTVERKSFLSYHRQRYPLHTFQVRQLTLPGNRLERIDSLSFMDRASGSNDQPLSTLKWFEPVLATTALASLIYLLWTTE